MRISIRTALPIATLLGAFALAGCGGGSSNDDISNPDNGGERPTNAGDCGGGTKLEGGKCVPDTSAADMKKAADDAVALYRKLADDENTHVGNGDATAVGAQITKAGMDGEFKSPDGKLHIMVYDRMGPGETGDPIKWGDDEATAALKTVTGSANAKFVMLTSNMPDSDGTLKNYATGHPEVTGTFRGMSGRFVCTNATDCAARKNPTSGYELTGTWAFEPSAGNDATFTVVTADTTYAQFGWWIDEDATTNANIDGIRTFARVMGTATAVVNDFANISGTATYEGKAAGQVAVHKGPASSDNVSGAFEADAMLTASFGDEDRISGTISNFMVGGASPGDWSVELMESTHDGSSAWGSAKTKWTMGSSAGGAAGEWNVALHEAGETVGDLKDPPKTAIGTFKSEYGTSGIMVGAFGADRN